MRSSHQTVSWITISRSNLPALSRFLLSSALLLLRTGLAFPATPTRCSRWLCACRMHAACRVGSSLRQPMHTPAATGPLHVTCKRTRPHSTLPRAGACHPCLIDATAAPMLRLHAAAYCHTLGCELESHARLQSLAPASSLGSFLL
jgi:hypothetical protein